jgi:Fe-S-cluster containining protein
MPPDVDELAVGPFSDWLAGFRAAIAGAADSDVPCGTCSACCRSSQFIHVEPDEHDALAHIPAELLVPAPGMPDGHLVMGYDEEGCCPMLVDDRCSIYAHRPRTCRVYDCRVFAATGDEIDELPLVAVQVRRWRFDHPTPRDRAEHDELLEAAAGTTDDFRSFLER